MQTAFSIIQLSSFSEIGEPPVSGSSSLTVNFQVFNRGPSHVAGLMVTTNFWITSQVVPGRFLDFTSNGGENWTVFLQLNGLEPGTTFEYVIFCDDFGGVNNVPRIWDTNGGNRFQIKANVA